MQFRNRIARVALPILMIAALPAQADGRALLDQVTGFITSLDALAFDAKMNSVFETTQGKNASEIDVSILLKGDDKAYIVSRSANDEAAIISDGETRIVHFVTKKQFASDPAPAERTKIISLVGGGPIRVGSSWLSELLHGHDALTAKLIAVEDGGVVALPGSDAGGEVRELRLRYETFDITMHVANEDPPLPQRVELDLSRQYKGSSEALSPKLSVVIQFANWDTAPDAPDSKFAWAPPEGVTKYEPPQAQTRLVRGENDFLGSPAPDFTLASLSGEQVTLSKHEGEDVVLLDFWATWCGPCRMAMPVVEEVAKQFEGKGVQLYAVNLRESPEKIRGFLKTVGVAESEVLIDKTGVVQRDYAANNIPRMVVVGKDGSIQAIHRGYSPYLRKSLTEQIEKLLAGEMLVEPKKG